MLQFLLWTYIVLSIPGAIFSAMFLIEKDDKFGPGWLRWEFWLLALASITPVIGLIPLILSIVYFIGYIRERYAKKLEAKLQDYSFLNMPVMIAIPDPSDGKLDHWKDFVRVNRCIKCSHLEVDQIIRGGRDLYRCADCGHEHGSIPEWNAYNNWVTHFHPYTRTKTIWELIKLSRVDDFDDLDFFLFVSNRNEGH